MNRLSYLRAVVVEGEAFLDQAIEELADIKAWILIHRGMTELGPHEEFMVKVQAQHHRINRVVDLMWLVHRRCTFTSKQALNELKQRRIAAPDIMKMASELRNMAQRSGRVRESIRELFEEDFVGITQHAVKVSYLALTVIPKEKS